MCIYGKNSHSKTSNKPWVTLLLAGIIFDKSMQKSKSLVIMSTVLLLFFAGSFTSCIKWQVLDYT